MQTDLVGTHVLVNPLLSTPMSATFRRDSTVNLGPWWPAVLPGHLKRLFFDYLLYVNPDWPIKCWIPGDPFTPR